MHINWVLYVSLFYNFLCSLLTQRKKSQKWILLWLTKQHKAELGTWNEERSKIDIMRYSRGPSHEHPTSQISSCTVYYLSTCSLILHTNCEKNNFSLEIEKDNITCTQRCHLQFSWISIDRNIFKRRCCCLFYAAYSLFFCQLLFECWMLSAILLMPLLSSAVEKWTFATDAAIAVFYFDNYLVDIHTIMYSLMKEEYLYCPRKIWNRQQ